MATTIQTQALVRERPRRERWPLLLIALFPLAVAAWRSTLPATFFAVSGDDFHRTIYAWEVTQGNLVPSVLWPPLQFWMEALVLQVYPHALVVPALVNVAMSTVALVCLALLGRALGLSYAGVAIQIVLAATLPWFIWLSLSGLAESIYFGFIALAYLAVARWRASGAERWLWAAAVGLLAAGLLRFDGWGHSLAFSIGAGWLWLRAPRPRPYRWLMAAALPWTFPVIWLIFHYIRSGDPFYFSDVTRNYWLETQGRLPLSTRLLSQVRDLWAVAGVMVPVSLVGLWLMRRRPGVLLLSLMWLCSLALLIQSTLNHTITQNNPIRLIIVHALLLTPGVALALQQLGRRGWGAALAAALVAILVFPRLAQVPNYPNGLPPDTMQVGRHIADLRASGQLPMGSPLVIELHFWDYIILHALTGDPGAVVYDREPKLVLKPGGEHALDDATNPSLLARPPEQLRGELANRHVRLVIAYTDRAVANLRPIARETLHADRWYVFLVE
jgi:hypothetical protein